MQQSVVSRHIARLEAESGSRLFRRTGRGLVLTELGQQVYPRVKSIIRDAQQLSDDIRTSSGILMGDVRFGLLPSTVPKVAGPLSMAVRQAWPQVRLHLTEGPSVQLQELLGEGRLDVAMLLREEGAETGDETVVARFSVCLVVPAHDPLAARDTIDFEEAIQLPLVLPNEANALRVRLAKLAKERGMALTQALEADSTRLQHELVASNKGVYAITSGSLDPLESRRLAAVRIVRPAMLRAVVIGVTPHRAHTRATREFARLLYSMVPALLQRSA